MSRVIGIFLRFCCTPFQLFVGVLSVNEPNITRGWMDISKEEELIQSNLLKKKTVP
jgi:hypothetical protein